MGDTEKSVTIKVTVNQGNEVVTITDDAGNTKVLNSVLVIGGCHCQTALYCFSGGSSSDLGWALGAMWRFCCMSSRDQEAHLRKAFNQFMAWCCTFLGIPLTVTEIDTKTFLERWEAKEAEDIEAMKKIVFN